MEHVALPPPAQARPASPARRHHGMDWLRIGAFALLILYHIGMVFSPWHWLVKSATSVDWLIAPMALLTPWRLALLFAVSGYASRRLFDRSGTIGAFLAARNARLLVPLAFGMAVLVPVEMWVRVRQHGYGGGYPAFWLHDYWRIGSFDGVAFPSWEHLWFIAYLWAYTMVLGLVIAGGARAGRIAHWLGRGHRLLWAPVAALVLAKLSLLFVVPEQQGLLSDWGGHAEYGPMFAFGFVLAGHDALWRALDRIARPAAIVAVLAGGIVVAVELAWPADRLPPHGVMALDRAARVAMAWTMVALLFHLAQTRLDHDHRWRAPLVRAVFPAYLLHHTALVLVAWETLPIGLPAAAEFAILLAAVVATCWAGYAIGARIGWIGTLIGMPHKVAGPARSARERATL